MIAELQVQRGGPSVSILRFGELEAMNDAVSKLFLTHRGDCKEVKEDGAAWHSICDLEFKPACPGLDSQKGQRTVAYLILLPRCRIGYIVLRSHRIHPARHRPAHHTGPAAQA